MGESWAKATFELSGPCPSGSQLGRWGFFPQAVPVAPTAPEQRGLCSSTADSQGVLPCPALPCHSLWNSRGCWLGGNHPCSPVFPPLLPAALLKVDFELFI